MKKQKEVTARVDDAINGHLDIGETFTVNGKKLTYDDYDETGAYCYDNKDNWYLVSKSDEQGYLVKPLEVEG